MIGVIDYLAGNSPSVMSALTHIGAPAKLVSTAEEILAADGLILPGVGAAGATIDSLEDAGLINAMQQRVLIDKVPFLGICVGLQVLFEHSEEDNVTCLEWLPGEVYEFPETVRVPQIGYNEVRFTKEHPLVEGLGGSGYFYFVNSYYARPDVEEHVLGKTEYGSCFASAIAVDNIMATQFHVEKSGESGLKMLRNFVRIVEEGVKLC